MSRSRGRNSFTQILEMFFPVFESSRPKCALNAPYDITSNTDKDAWIAETKDARRPVAILSNRRTRLNPMRCFGDQLMLFGMKTLSGRKGRDKTVNGWGLGIMCICIQGLPAFCAYFTSQRGESTQSIGRNEETPPA